MTEANEQMESFLSIFIFQSFRTQVCGIFNFFVQQGFIMFHS